MMSINIYSVQGAVKCTVQPLASSVYRAELMTSEYVQLVFKSDRHDLLSHGDYIIWQNKQYKVIELVKPNRSGNGFQYEQKFCADWMEWGHRILFYDRGTGSEKSWKLTGGILQFLDVVISNLKTAGFGTFKAYADIALLADIKYIQFDSTDIISALNSIAQEWGTEWYIDDDFICMGKCELGEQVTLTEGEHIKKITQQRAQDANYCTRLYAFGSDRNLPADYHSAEGGIIAGVADNNLRLPYGMKFIDAREGMATEEIVEGAAIFEDVYPRQIGTIATVTTKEYADTNTDTGEQTKWNAYRFTDSSLTFSEQYVLPGQELRLIFQSGNLAGMDFAVKFNPDAIADESQAAAQVFEIVRNEDYGAALPSERYYPKVGDTYVLYGYDTKYVADNLVSAAEHELLEVATAWLADVVKDTSTYECQMNEIRCKGYSASGVFDRRNIINLEIGNRVRIISELYGILESRVRAVEVRVDGLGRTYTIGKSAQYSKIASLAQDVNNIISLGGSGGGVNVAEVTRICERIIKSHDKEYLHALEYDEAEAKLRFLDTTYWGEFNEEKADVNDKICVLGNTYIDGTAYATKHKSKDAIVENNAQVNNDLAVGNIATAQHLDIKSTSQMRETTFGDFTKGLIVGANTGARIYESGHADLKSLSISEFLEVPELRFNRATVEIGITIRSLGGGVIEEVRPDLNADGTKKNSGYALLKLEEGEVGAISMYDMNMGFWHNEGDGGGGVGANADENGNAKENVDKHNGDYELAGFSTVYFLIDEIPDEYYDKEKGANVKNTMSKCFHYTLRSGGDWLNTHHPHEGMHFGQIGNTNNKERQSFVITTTTYQLWLQGVNTWNYQTSNIYRIDGQLDGFAMESQRGGEVFRKEFSGNGTVLGNAYIYGGIDQFERAEIKLEITFDGDYMLAFGEEKMMSCVVTNGYGENITNQVTEWDISRDSGNVNDDKAWKNTNKVKEFLSGATGGTLILSYTKDDNDLGNSTSCLFSIVAKIGTQTAEASLSI